MFFPVASTLSFARWGVLEKTTWAATRVGPRAILYQAQVSSVEEFGRWVLGFGGEVEIIGPPELKEWVIRTAEGILSRNHSAS